MVGAMGSSPALPLTSPYDAMDISILHRAPIGASSASVSTANNHPAIHAREVSEPTDSS